MTAIRLIALGSLLALVAVAPAGAYWEAGGVGAGTAGVATMPVGEQPEGSVSGQNVTVAWSQSTFLGEPLGSLAGGGYRVTRYPAAGGSAVTPGTACDAAVTGAAATLECTESAVPLGEWQYAVTPLLDSFTGREGPRSVTVAVRPAAPSTDPITATNPAAGAATGNLELSWAAVAGATGYNLYRRASTDSYDFAAPVNGATPVTGTTYTDAGAGLAPGTTYAYVVRAVGGSPPLESADSDERQATPISRPAAPTGVLAVATAGARIDVSWPAVAGVAGYNVYRRLSSGSYDFAAPLNGAAPLTGTAFADTTATDGTTYRYSVRSVITGAGGAQVESTDAESAAATADGTPPPAPLGVSVDSGGNVMATTRCSVTAGTRYLNAAGVSSVSVTATIPAPEVGQSVVFSAVTPGSTPVAVTVPAGGTSVTATMNLGTLLDGTVTLTARTKDAAGNLSGTLAPANVVIKDVVAPPLTASYSGGLLGLGPSIKGDAQCGAGVRAVKTSGGNAGSLWPSGGPHVITSGTAYSFSVEGPLLGLGSVTYDVTATDRAGNAGAVVTTGG